MAEFTKGQRVFVPGDNRVYHVIDIRPDSELWCQNNGYQWDTSEENLRVYPDKQPVIPLSQVLAAPAMLAALKGMMDWARRITTPTSGMEVFNARAAIAAAERTT